jgi:membrane protein
VLIGTVFLLILFGTLTGKLQDQVGILGIIPMLLAGVAMVGLWTFVQWHLPRADVPWQKLVPGAVLVALGIEGLQIVTVVWFSRYLESKSETYGAIGAALAILLWAYFLGRILVSGAMLNAALHEQEQRAATPDGPPPAEP